MYKISLLRLAQRELVRLPVGIQAVLIKAMDELEACGHELREPYVRDMGQGLKELRVSAKEGIGRGFFLLPPPSAGLYHSPPTEKNTENPKTDTDIGLSAHERTQTEIAVMKKTDDFDIIPFAVVKAAALSHPQVNDAYTDLQIRQAMMTELKAARQQCNLTQEEVALRAGLKKQNISRMEKGIISPNLTTLSRYAAALGGTFVFQFNPNSSYATKE